MTNLQAGQVVREDLESLTGVLQVGQVVREDLESLTGVLWAGGAVREVLLTDTLVRPVMYDDFRPMRRPKQGLQLETFRVTTHLRVFAMQDDWWPRKRVRIEYSPHLIRNASAVVAAFVLPRHDREGTQNTRTRHLLANEQPVMSTLFNPPPNGYAFTFAELIDTTFVDWGQTDATATLLANYEIPADLSPKLSPFQQPGMPPSFLIPDIQADYMHYTWAPWVYVFMKETTESTADTDGSLWRVRWNWANNDASPRVTPLTEMYEFSAGKLVSTARRKMRGKGRSIQIEFNSEPLKNFQVLGWAVWTNKNTAP